MKAVRHNESSVEDPVDVLQLSEVNLVNHGAHRCEENHVEHVQDMGDPNTVSQMPANHHEHQRDCVSVQIKVRQVVLCFLLVYFQGRISLVGVS